MAMFGANALTASAAGPPTVTSLTPANGPVAGGNPVAIVGTDFIAGSTVTFDGNPVTAVIVDTEHITATAPGHAAGVVDVVVTNTDGASATSAASQYTYNAPAPTVLGLSPANGTTAGGTSVTITGTDFTGATAVAFGLTNALYTVNNNTTITATSPAHVGAGIVDVRVTTSGGQSATSPADQFTYTVSIPTVTALTPAGGPVGGATPVTITGTGFTGATLVTFGGIPLTPTVVNDTTITVTSPAHAAGTVDVFVTTPGGTNANTAGDNFTYGSGPVVTAVSPTTGPLAGGTVVTVTGTGLTGATSVNFGGTIIVPTSVTDTSLNVVSPPHAAGVVDIIVTTPVGVSANTAADNFAFTNAPVVTAVTPNAGPVAGGTVVTVTGSGFTGATSVTFGGVAGTSLSVVNDTSLLVTTPAHTAGTVDVIVTTPLGTSANTAADNFVFGSGPVISSLSPTSGPIAGGTVVTITGTGFTGATSVSFGGTTATPTVVNDTSLTVVTPAHANGDANVTVTTPVGTSAAVTFSYGTGSTVTYTLYFRWTLLVWSGKEGAPITATLAGQETPDNPATNNVSGVVTAIYRYNNALQKFEGWFPNSDNIPGANDFNVFNQGQAYWIAVNATGSTSWTVVGG
jgi:hypothetical protein